MRAVRAGIKGKHKKTGAAGQEKEEAANQRRLAVPTVTETPTAKKPAALSAESRYRSIPVSARAM
jgi:hypothetical protein